VGFFPAGDFGGCNISQDNQAKLDPFVYGAELGQFFEISDVDSMSAYSGRLSGRTFIMTLFFLFHHTIPAGSSPLPLPGYLLGLRLPMEELDIKYRYLVFRAP